LKIRQERQGSKEKEKNKMYAKKMLFLGAFIVVTVLSLLTITTAHAAWLTDAPVTVTQPDGTVLNIFATGDEFYNWLHDANGYTIVQDPHTGYYVYADLVDGELVPTEYVVGVADPASVGLSPNLNISGEKMEAIRQSSLELEAQSDLVAQVGTPLHDAFTNLVIFVRFTDPITDPPGINPPSIYEKEFSDPISTYDAMFSDSTPGANSLANYYYEASYDDLYIHSHLYPTPPGSTVISCQDPNSHDYYLPSSEHNGGGYPNDGTPEALVEQKNRENGLVQRAVECINSLGQFPPASDIDANNDGYVDSVTIILKGDTGGDILWPHEWELTQYDVRINGKRVFKYDIQVQDFLLNNLGTGVLAHEMGHILGAHDLYHYKNSLRPVGPWDVMGNETNPPEHMGCYMKKRFGWLRFYGPEIATPGKYTLNPLTSPTGNCARIDSPNPNQFFVLEYRQKPSTGFESGLPGSGLLVYRINVVWDGNRDGPPDEVYVYRPGGTLSADGDVNQAYFSSDVGRTEMNDSTDPSSFLADGRPSGLDICYVSSPGPTISFRYGNCDSLPAPFGKSSPSNGGSSPLNMPLAWSNSDYVLRYEYCLRTDNDTDPDHCDWQSTGTDQFADTGSLQLGTTYYWQVRAVNNYGVTYADDGTWWSFNTWEPPSSFSKIGPSDGAINQPLNLTLSWGTSWSPHYIVFYQYCYETVGDSSCDDKSIWMELGTSTSTTPPNLQPWTTYRWQVRASGSTEANDGTWWTFTTSGPPLAFSKNTPYNGASGLSLNPTLSWSSAYGATSYAYCYDLTNDNDCSNFTDVGLNTSVTLSGLEAGKTYYWQVRANNSATNSFTYANGGAFWFFTTNTLPGSFSKASPSDYSTNQPADIELSWNTSSGATSYEYCHALASVFSLTCAPASSSWANVGTVTSVTPDDLQPNASYLWQVRARNNAGITEAGVAGFGWHFTTGSSPGPFHKTSPATGSSGQPLSVTLSWGTSIGATSYEYCYDIVDNSQCDATWVSVGTSTSATLTGLRRNTTFYWQVRAVNGFGEVGADRHCPMCPTYDWWSFTTNDNPGYFSKTAPANGATGQPTTITFSWSSSSRAASYQYCYNTTMDVCPNDLWTPAGTNTSVTVSGWAPNTTYYWQVQALNNVGIVTADIYSTHWFSFTTGSLPGIFGKSSPANGATGQPSRLTLSWSASNGATSYQYCYDKVNDDACNNSWIDVPSGTSAVITDLDGGATTYYWQIRAVNGIGITNADFPEKKWRSFTTTPAPGAFTKVEPTSGATNQPLNLTLSWGASTGATLYEYCYAIDSAYLSACAPSSTSWGNVGTKTSVSINGLSPYSVYSWQIRATNAKGTTYANGSSVASWSFTTSGVPGAFNKTNPANHSTSQPLSLTLSWSASSGAASYEYCYDTINNNACNDVWRNIGTNTSVTFGGLNPNIIYYWQVRAVNNVGVTYSDSGSWWSFTTGILSGSFGKTGPVNGATNQPLSLILTWEASSGASSYEYCYYDTNDDPCSSWVNAGNSTSALISGLSYGTIYSWQVRAKNSFGTRYANGYAWWSFTTIPIQTITFNSTSSQDGWVLESSETSGHGGSISATASTLRLGDDAAKKQYRSILSFSTGSSLPDTAVITKVTLKVRKQSIVGGGNPVTTFQGFMVDIKKGYFGTTALQAADFQTAASKTYGPFKPALSGSWYSIDLTGGKAYINKLSSYSGLTQIRMRFKLDDYNNTIANYLSLYSGNAGSSYRPQLIVEYYVP
jgi:M6 family metalloprotease-like protein